MVYWKNWCPSSERARADADPPPFDDPMSLYESDPDTRVQMQAIWRGRGRVASDFWRLNLVVLIDGRCGRQHFTCPSTGSAPPKPPVTPSGTTPGRSAPPRRSVMNGTDWDTRRGEPALIQRWRITREQWLPRRRDDIALSGVEACRQAFQAIF